MTLALTGDDAPAIDFDGARLVLRYADPDAYARRCSADDAAVRALASHVVVEASCAQEPQWYGGPLEGGPMRVTYALASRAVAPKTTPTESPQRRR